MSNQQRMKDGLAYLPMDADILAKQLSYIETLNKYNVTRPQEQELRQKFLKEMFASIGEDCYFEPPLHSNFGCRHVFCGNHVYANFNLTLVDDGNIFIGDKVMFAPNVTLATASHPINPLLRSQGYQYNRDIRIGENVWIGVGVIVLPGVTIGENSVIGAGSVVTRDIPANVVAFGSPCRVIREIGEFDHQFLYANCPIDWENLSVTTD